MKYYRVSFKDYRGESVTRYVVETAIESFTANLIECGAEFRVSNDAKRMCDW